MGVSIGAIRWDSFHSGLTDVAKYGQYQIGPQKWQYRAPWFSTVVSPHRVSCLATQANMDLELQLASQAGLKFWAYDLYTPMASDDLMVAWNFHQNSAYKSLVKWCCLGGLASIMNYAQPLFNQYDVFSNTAGWQAGVALIVTHFLQPNYLKVLGNRPVYFLMWDNPTAGWLGGNIANGTTVLNYLTAACIAAGLGAPYIVYMDGYPANSGAHFASLGGSGAISNYIPVTAYQPSLTSVYTDYDGWIRTYWGTLLASGFKVVPNGCTGWDCRDQAELPVGIGSGTRATKPFTNTLTTILPGTPAQVATHVQALVSLIQANPVVCETNLGLLYSWTECSEGGKALIPTLGDPPVNVEAGQPLLTSNLLAAIGPILRANA